MYTSYVLITPARNEEAFIEKTIQSVISQTILPQTWVIVSDGSIDRTEEIVHRYTLLYNFIQLIQIKSNENRNFSSKARAFNTGYTMLENVEYDFIGNLDADISFESNYFEKILVPTIHSMGIKIETFKNVGLFGLNKRKLKIKIV